MADGAACVKSFGRDYFCEPMAVFKPAGAPEIAAPAVKAEEPRESCHYRKMAGDYFEVCTPRSKDAAAKPGATIWDALGNAVKYILEANAKYQPTRGSRR